jgi:rhodanese-related sulfurtransferase
LDEVEAEARSGGYRLITTEDLAKRIQEAPDSLMVVDTRQEWEYAAGHVKGAENFPMEPTVWARYSKKAPMEQFLGSDKNRVIVFS